MVVGKQEVEQQLVEVVMRATLGPVTTVVEVVDLVGMEKERATQRRTPVPTQTRVVNLLQMVVRGGPGLILIFEVWVVLVVVVLEIGQLLVVAGTVVGQVYTPGVMPPINTNPVEVEVPTIVVLISRTPHRIILDTASLLLKDSRETIIVTNSKWKVVRLNPPQKKLRPQKSYKNAKSMP
jgi:hypothetical protein